MRHTICLLVPLLFAAPLMQAAGLAGRFQGDWQGAAAGGGFTITLAPATEGKWDCQVSFTIADQEVKTKVTFVRVEGQKLEARYEFDLAGARLESSIAGELRDSRLEGTYRTKALPEGNQVDEGAWKAARVE